MEILARNTNKEHVVHRTTYYLDVIRGCDTVGGKTDTSFTGHALSQGLWKIRGEVGRKEKELPSLGIYSREKNEKRHERGTRWLCRWMGAFVTGRIQSEILYRVSGFHLFSARARASTSPPSPLPASIVAPSKSESPIFSRFFRELENERFAFEFISTLLFLFLNTFCSAWKNHEEGFQFLIAL